MYNDNVMSKKTFQDMTAEEKVQDLYHSCQSLFDRTARMNDELSYLRAEVLYWRRLHAIQQGLSNEQIDRLFGNPGIGGLAGLPSRY